MKTQMPEVVKKALGILYATFGIGVVRTFFEAPRVAKEIAPTLGGVGPLYFGIMFGFLITAFLTWQISRRKNWARWVFTMFFVVGLPSAISPLLQSLKKTPLIGVLDLLQLAVQIMALVFLFQAPAREWFKKQAITQAQL